MRGPCTTLELCVIGCDEELDFESLVREIQFGKKLMRRSKPRSLFFNDDISSLNFESNGFKCLVIASWAIPLLDTLWNEREPGGVSYQGLNCLGDW